MSKCNDCKTELDPQEKGITWDVLFDIPAHFKCNQKLYGRIDKMIKHIKRNIVNLD